MSVRILRRLRDLLDVDTSGAAVGDRLTLDADGETWVPAAASGGSGSADDVSVTPFGSVASTNVQDALEEIVAEAVAGAPVGADYLVGTANGGLSAEIVVGTTPGGELGGSWASPTVDTTHSGSSHAGVQAAAEATAAAALSAHETDATDAHDATAISTVPAGSLAATNVQTSLAELDAEKAATSHAHAGEDITSGTVADARIASTIARDAEVSSAISAHEAAGDPHPVYVTGAEAVTAIVGALNAADGAGLADDGAGVLSVNVDGSTLEISSDALRVKASGITANEIAANAVGSSELADDAVDTGAIANGAVTAAKVAADVATQAELDAHVNDTSAAHAASAISADSTTLVGTGTDVQAVLEELDNGIADHLADTSAAHAASAISADSTTLVGTGTTVQAVLEELDDAIAAAGGGSSPSYAKVSDVKAQNTDGGTFTSGAYRTRDLNTEVDADGILTLASNQVVLAAGTYDCHITAPACHVKRHKTRLYNVTGSAVVLEGTSHYNGTGNADATSTVSEIRGRFTIAASQTLEVQHRCESTMATIGFGVASNFAAELYTIAEFWKVA